MRSSPKRKSMASDTTNKRKSTHTPSRPASRPSKNSSPKRKSKASDSINKRNKTNTPSRPTSRPSKDSRIELVAILEQVVRYGQHCHDNETKLERFEYDRSRKSERRKTTEDESVSDSGNSSVCEKEDNIYFDGNKCTIPQVGADGCWPIERDNGTSDSLMKENDSLDGEPNEHESLSKSSEETRHSKEESASRPLDTSTKWASEYLEDNLYDGALNKEMSQTPSYIIVQPNGQIKPPPADTEPLLHDYDNNVVKELLMRCWQRSVHVANSQVYYSSSLKNDTHSVDSEIHETTKLPSSNSNRNDDAKKRQSEDDIQESLLFETHKMVDTILHCVLMTAKDKLVQNAREGARSSANSQFRWNDVLSSVTDISENACADGNRSVERDDCICPYPDLMSVPLKSDVLKTISMRLMDRYVSK